MKRTSLRILCSSGILLLGIPAVFLLGRSDSRTEGRNPPDPEARSVAPPAKGRGVGTGEGPAARNGDGPPRRKDSGTLGSPRRGIGRTGPPPPGAAVFPDGTWLPPLNGVLEAPPFPGFEAGRPYAPVIRIDTDPVTGLQTWVHADGTRSNTQRIRREEGGRVWFEPGWVVGHPRSPLPFRGGARGESRREE